MIGDSNAEHVMSPSRGGDIHCAQGEKPPRRFHKHFGKRFLSTAVYSKNWADGYGHGYGRK